MIGALFLAAIAVICAGLALQYAWEFYGGVRKRHAAKFSDLSIFARSDTILALNDADTYASWRLVRVNLTVAAVCLTAAAAISVVLRG